MRRLDPLVSGRDVMSPQSPCNIRQKFDLMINLKTTKALGLDVPLHLQQIANEVIE